MRRLAAALPADVTTAANRAEGRTAVLALHRHLTTVDKLVAAQRSMSQVDQCRLD
jgi:hypothetical protein